MIYLLIISIVLLLMLLSAVLTLIIVSSFGRYERYNSIVRNRRSRELLKSVKTMDRIGEDGGDC